MPKSDKATVMQRVDDVLRLILAGAEFPEIRHYASEHNWDVSERQVRRYLEAAYCRLAQMTERNRDQLLGRHLMQRRALYARCLRGDDLRTALIVLKDEAALEGLYPPTKIAPTTPDGRQLWPETKPEDRRQRAVRLLAAEERDDEVEQLLLENKTPRLIYRFPDTLFPILFLHVMTLMYVVEQLEHAGQFLHAEWRKLDHGDPDGQWSLAAQASAYRFKIGLEGWLQFTEELGVNSDYLVAGNYHGCLLQLCDLNLSPLAPTADELKRLLQEAGESPEGDLLTSHDLQESWSCLFSELCDR